MEASPCADGRRSIRRWVITKMVLENFKSYAGKSQIGPYHKKFTAIVGPNGSGKSNVIDAMLFVFGKKAKQIRLDRLSSLIHKSDQHPNLRHASVTVHFQEIIDFEDSEEEYELVPGTEMTLSRHCSIDNSSRYEVNGRKSTYAEVTSLLREKGVDLDHNRFLILQGEVESIALMKPKSPNDHEDGLLEYVEDIIGTKYLKPMIEDGEKVVEKLTEEREMHMQRVQSSEKDREALSGAKQGAEEFLRVDTKLTKLQAKYLQVKLVGVTNGLEAKEAAVKDVRERVTAEKAKTEDARQKVEEMGRELKEKKKGCDRMQKSFDKVQEEYRELDAAAAETRTNTEHSRKKVKYQLAQADKAQAEITKIQKASEKAVREYGMAVEELEHLEPKLESKQEELSAKTEALQPVLKPLRERREVMQKRLIPFNEAVAEAESDLKTAQQKIKGLQEQAETVRGRIESATADRDKARTTIGELTERLREVEANLEATQNKERDDSQQLERIKVVFPRVGAKVQEKLSSVEQRKAAANQLVQGSQLSKELNALKERGGLDGYFGRLGDLGSIDDRFDIPISTAASGMLSHHVCDNAATAQKILDHLKQNTNLRANLILLDKQEAFRRHVTEAKPDCPPGTTRLFDHIRPVHPRFATVFYWAVRNTLVADDMDTAGKAAFGGSQRHRVVTYQGQIIEPSGKMSGGGRAMKGAMGRVAFDPSQLEQLKKDQEELTRLSADERKLSDTMNETQLRIGELRQQGKNLEREQRNIASQLRSEQAKEKIAVKLLKDCERELEATEAAADGNAVKQAEAEVSNARKGQAKAVAARKDLQDQMELLNREIADAGGVDFARLKDVVQQTKEQVARNTQLRDKSAAGKEASKKQLEKAQKRYDSLKAEAEALTKDLERRESENSNDDGRLAEAKEKVCEFRKQFEEAKREVDKLEALRQHEKDKIQSNRTAQVQLEHELSEKQQDYEEGQRQRQKLIVTLERMQDTVRSSIREYGVGVLDPADIADPQTFEPDDFTLILPREELDSVVRSDKVEDMRTQMSVLEESKKKMNPNVQAIREWRVKNALYLKRVEEMKEVNDKRLEEQGKVEQLRKRRHDDFMKGFKAITLKLKEMYQMLTMGGDAELELVDSFDPFSEGLQFCVRPPRKSWKNITNLSGGEKTLSSLALVFALHHFKPTPLYVMDEIDAALDFKNVSIVANYVKSAARNAQFIIISLRNNMFELSNRLVGIFKTDNCTGSVAVNPGCFAGLLPAPSREAAARHGIAAAACSQRRQQIAAKRKREEDADEEREASVSQPRLVVDSPVAP